MKYFLSFHIVLFLSLIAHSQCGTSLGMENISGQNDEECHSIIELSQGGYASISAMTGGSLSGQWLITRFDENFDVIWSKQYGTNSNETGDNLLLKQTDNGNLIAVGHTLQGSLRVMSMLQVDLNGTIQWNLQLPGFSSPGETAADIIDLNDGTYLIVGTTNSYSIGSSDGLAVRLDSSGNILWKSNFGTSNNDHFYTASLLLDGSILCAGESSNRGWLVLLDTEGNLIESKRLSDSASSILMDSVVLPSGELLFSGRVAFSSSDCLLLKTNSDFDVQVSKRLALGGASSFASTLGIMSDERLAISAVTSTSFSNTGTPALVICESIGNLEILNCVSQNGNEVHQALIRGQNLIVSNNRPVQVFWSTGNDENGKILIADECGDSECSTSLIFTEELVELSFADFPIQTGGIPDFVTVEWTELDYQSITTLECEVECNAEFTLVVPGQICSSEETSLTPSPAGSYSLGNITWLLNDVEISLDNTLVLSNLDQGEYELEVTVGDETNSCFTEEIFDFVVLDLPTINIPENLFFCDLPNTELSEYQNFTWFSSTGQQINPLNIASAGLYVVSSSNLCGEVEASVLIETDNSIPPLFNPLLLCPDEPATLELPDSFGFLFNGQNVSGEVDINSTNSPSLIAVSNQGCSYPISLIIEDLRDIYNPNLFTEAVCENDVSSIQFEQISNDGVWIYNTNDGITWAPSVGENEVIYSTQCGDYPYTIEVLPSYICDCQAWIPNSFTPDFDGINDVWLPVFNIQPFWYEIEVYNRWGQKIFFGNSLDEQPWISDYNSNNAYHQQNEVYNYILEYQCYEDVEVIQKKGTVVLLR